MLPNSLLIWTRPMTGRARLQSRVHAIASYQGTASAVLPRTLFGCHPEEGFSPTRDRQLLMADSRGPDSCFRPTCFPPDGWPRAPLSLSSRPRASARAEGPAVRLSRKDRRYLSPTTDNRQPTTDNRQLVSQPPGRHNRSLGRKPWVRSHLKLRAGFSRRHYCSFAYSALACL